MEMNTSDKNSYKLATLAFGPDRLK